MAKKAPGLAILIAGKGKPPKMKKKEDMGYKDDKMDVASELMEAMKNNDKEAFAESLEAFIELCM